MHCEKFLTYDYNIPTSQILTKINSYVKKQGDINGGYHFNLTFHCNSISENYDEALKRINKFIKEDYDDHAVIFKSEEGKKWLIKIEYHC